MADTNGTPVTTDDELARRIIGLPRINVNTPAMLPGVGLSPGAGTPTAAAGATPAAPPSPPIGVPPKALYEQPSTVTPSPTSPTMPKIMSPLESQTNQALAERQRLTDNGPGWQGVKNPFLRTLARIGDITEGIALPGAAIHTPGTTLHHEALLGLNARQLGTLEGAQREEAQTGEINARAAAIPQETAQKNAETQAQLSEHGLQVGPDGKITPTPEEQLPATTKTEQELKRAQITNLLNPQAKTAFEAWQKQHPDADVGEFLKLQAENKSGNDFEQFYKDYLADSKLPDTAHNRETARKEWAAASQAPQRAPVTNVFVPNGQGGYTATPVHGGQTVPEGAVTTAGMNSLNVPTAQTRTMAETAPKVMDLATRINQLVDQQVKSLGPAASRWNEFMAGSVGAPNPEFTKLRTDVGLLQTALMRMHVGARGGEQMMEHFRNLIDVSKQSPENLKAALGEIQEYARAVQSEGRGNQPQAQAGNAPAVGTVENGYKFKGGNPADQSSWEKVK